MKALPHWQKSLTGFAIPFALYLLTILKALLVEDGLLMV